MRGLLGITITLILTLGLATSSLAQQTDTFNIDGRKVKVSYRQTGSTIKTKGFIKGGAPCKQLNVDIFLDNSKKEDTAHTETTIRHYKTKGRSFSAESETYLHKKYRSGWYVSNIYLQCME
ncbi:hypothetical protein [Desulfotalea psychrophila]|uniref:Uncharacterized protein n=1 Tax=Desulfotalea psychrophila (strain LSv54 / DSM 12343) TaxID=177439 RepID=Q6AMX7_DESPS|nr:hypothetical protein [Desulfotalea psychrophila]CAG36297.1 unknown protein [Desulfotalea psychrophila LSv54]